MTTAAQRQLSQLLAVVALLLGLLAMHGLANGHHAPALPLAASPAAAAHGQHQAPDTTPGHVVAMAAAGLPLDAAVPPGRPLMGESGASCDGDCAHDLAALCLAVLSAGAAALALLVARRTRPLPLPALPLAVLPRPGPPLRLRPPDPVRDLCISRT